MFSVQARHIGVCSVIPAPRGRGQRQADHKFKVSLDYMERFWPKENNKTLSRPRRCLLSLRKRERKRKKERIQGEGNFTVDDSLMTEGSHKFSDEPGEPEPSSMPGYPWVFLTCAEDS